MGAYTVVLTASSAVRLEPGESVALSGIRSSHGEVTCKWFTRYADENFTSPVPRELCIEVQGDAQNLDSALSEFADIGRALTILIAFVGNAGIDDATWELAFDSNPTSESREFIQQFVGAEDGIPRFSRRLDRGLVAPVAKGIFESPDFDRLHRAMVHYNEALKAWRPGLELRSVSHLWMAAEALTQVALHCELHRLGFSVRDELAAAWSLEPKLLDAEIRRRLIFSGDAQTYSQSRALSDATEHAFKPFADLHPGAQGVRDRLAGHIRNAILQLTPLGDDQRTALLSERLAVPLESFPIATTLRSRIVGLGPHLRAEGRLYPQFLWTQTIRDVARQPDGSYQITPSDTFTAALGPGLSFSGATVERRGPRPDQGTHP